MCDTPGTPAVEPDSDQTPVEKEFIWRVTMGPEGEVDITFGPTLSERPIDDDAKLWALGKALMNLGTRLVTSTVHGDEDEDYEGDDDD